MGTRGSIGWHLGDIDPDVLLYNHFDSYPEGVGVDVLGHARRAAKDFGAVCEAVAGLTVVDETGEPTPEQVEDLFSKGVSPQNVSTGANWYAWLRGAQGNLDAYLQLGYAPVNNSFVYDSLFCEWAYVVNLAEKKLEVYRGFQKAPGNGRYGTPPNGPEAQGYYGVSLLITFPFSDLPTDEEFLRRVNEAADEEG